MEFEKKLTGKILDPIHGTIRITEIERKVIAHRLFQRLRDVKQNTFLYKVFPSAMHSRLEHSLGVMHIAYEIFRNLIINSYRYKVKYHDNLIFTYIDKIDENNIQELRLAALLHDIGHGPMSHQFDNFLLKKSDMESLFGKSYEDIFSLIPDDDPVEHEHISLIFIKRILSSLDSNEHKVNVDNVIKLIKPNYSDSKINSSFEDSTYNLLPLLSSLISSCPIDSDRMDYLLRDSYFSGVKCGIYNVERLLMSIVPIVDKNNNVCLAYKESCLDSISEFIFSRSNLFSQVYFHKTNRSFSAMLSKVCNTIKSENSESIINMYKFKNNPCENIDILEEFYIKNSDEYFIKNTIQSLLNGLDKSKNIIQDIVSRKPWKKFYESKIYNFNAKITDHINKSKIEDLKKSLEKIIEKHIPNDSYIVEIMTDNAFKDINKTEIKLLIKKPDGSYESRRIVDCDDKLNGYQSIRYFIRVFVDKCSINNPDNDSMKIIKKELNDKCQTYHQSFQGKTTLKVSVLGALKLIGFKTSTH
jgi:uncharacterized protein